MADRQRLDIVDDPVARSNGVHATAASREPRAKPSVAKPRQRRIAAVETSQPAEPPGPAELSQPDETLRAAEAPQRAEKAPRAGIPQAVAPAAYGDEQKRAVFGRVPRSLSRRLERAVVELREEMEDLTQEQLLAALLDHYVDPSSPKQLGELAAIIRDYRGRL